MQDEAATPPPLRLVEDLPEEGAWVTWLHPIADPDSDWRTYPHLQDKTSWREAMWPRVQEFHRLLELHGLRPDTIECQVCRPAGRTMIDCFDAGVGAGGGRQHLRRLWTVALSVGPGLWQETVVKDGMVRYNYVDGSVELCRGKPPSGTFSSLAAGGRRGRAYGRAQDGTKSPLGTNCSTGDTVGDFSSRTCSTLKASPPSTKEATGGKSLGRAETLNGTDVEADGYDSEREERVVLDKRPFGLEIEPVEEGRGAVVQHASEKAVEAGVDVGATILSINEQPVEDLATAEIQGMLEDEALPVTLDLRPPPLNLPGARTFRRPRKRDPVIVCVSGCRGSYKVVSEAIGQLGWTEVPTDARNSSVVWLEHSDPTEGLAPVQTVTRIEAFLHFCKKAPLAQSLNAWVDFLPDEFEFFPKTWVLPYDAGYLKAAMARDKETYIAKPTGGAQGKGIVLARKWRDLEKVVQKTEAGLLAAGGRVQNMTEYVVQRYFSDPLLLDGLKFDMRLYVVVTSVVPLRAYLFKEGLARFCTVPYQMPKEGNLRDSRMHLTNFALNKNSKDFHTTETLSKHDEGSKRSASAVLHQIEKMSGVSPEIIWDKVARLAANTLMALRPGLVEFHAHEKQRPLHPLGPKAFQLLGLDILIDNNLEPRLLELNANSSLSATQPGPLTDEVAESPQELTHSKELRSRTAGSGDTLPAIISKSPTSAKILQNMASIPQAAADTAMFPRSPSSLWIPGASMRQVSGEPRAYPRSFSSVGVMSTQNQSSQASAPSESQGATRRPGSAGPPAPTRRGRNLRHQSRSRASRSIGTSSAGGADKPPMITSELDMEVKRELVAQALLLAHPAPQNKTVRLRRLWDNAAPRSASEIVPLDDTGAWVLPQKASRAEAVRLDAPDRCPALEALNFDELAAGPVREYAQAHLALYRWWCRSCGQGRDSVGQAPILRLLERCGLVGNAADALFPDRVTAQLWISRVWRDMTGGAFGLNLPQFVGFAGRIGQMLLGSADTDDGDEDPPSRLECVLEFVRSGLCGNE